MKNWSVSLISFSKVLPQWMGTFYNSNNNNNNHTQKKTNQIFLNRIEYLTWIYQMAMIYGNMAIFCWMVSSASNHMKTRKRNIVTLLFSRKSWFWWKYQNPVIMDCIHILMRLTCLTIALNHHLGGELWAVIHVIHCCWHANHNLLHSLFIWKLKLNVING